jgi:hypothetical protein
MPEAVPGEQLSNLEMDRVVESFLATMKGEGRTR